MGFWGGVGRMIAGKPVFESTSQPTNNSSSTDTSTTANTAQPVLEDVTKTSVDSRGYKIIPKLSVKPIKAWRNGDNMSCTSWITNESKEEVRVDYIMVANQKQAHNHIFSPGQAHELKVYDGPVMQNTNYTEAKIVFRLMRSDDVFENSYRIEYNQESDGKFTLEEFHSNGEARDI